MDELDRILEAMIVAVRTGRCPECDGPGRLSDDPPPLYALHLQDMPDGVVTFDHEPACSLTDAADRVSDLASQFGVELTGFAIDAPHFGGRVQVPRRAIG